MVKSYAPYAFKWYLLDRWFLRVFIFICCMRSYGNEVHLFYSYRVSQCNSTTNLISNLYYVQAEPIKIRINHIHMQCNWAHLSELVILNKRERFIKYAFVTEIWKLASRERDALQNRIYFYVAYNVYYMLYAYYNMIVVQLFPMPFSIFDIFN